MDASQGRIGRRDAFAMNTSKWPYWKRKRALRAIKVEERGEYLCLDENGEIFAMPVEQFEQIYELYAVPYCDKKGCVDCTCSGTKQP